MSNKKYTHINDYRKLLIKTLGNKCKKCGSVYNLQIHHKKYSDNIKLTDVEVLCSDCHGTKFNPKRKNFKQKLQFNGKNYCLYIPIGVVKALNLKQGQELELKINAKEFRVVKKGLK